MAAARTGVRVTPQALRSKRALASGFPLLAPFVGPAGALRLPAMSQGTQGEASLPPAPAPAGDRAPAGPHEASNASVVPSLSVASSPLVASDPTEGSPPAEASRPPADEIDRLIEAIEQKKVGLAAGAEGLVNLFKKHDLCYVQSVAPRQLGFDPANRGSEGGNLTEVKLLMDDILYWGWAWDRTEHALCVEITPGDHSILDFNRQITQGIRPPLLRGQLAGLFHFGLRPHQYGASGHRSGSGFEPGKRSAIH